MRLDTFIRRATAPCAVALSLVVSIAQAQSADQPIQEDFQPSSLNRPGQQYPQVNSQGYSRYRVEAPEANSVKVTMGGGTSLTKAADGSWMGTTTRPADEGFHY